MNAQPIRCLATGSVPATLDEAGRFFEDMAGSELVQHWLPEPEPFCRPGQVWICRSDSHFGVYAVLQDEDISNSAREENSRTWETGDTFEIFLRPLPGLRYFEFHVTPENQKLQMAFESEDFFRQRVASGLGKDDNWLAGVGLPAGSFSSETQVEAPGKIWRVWARIPLALFGSAAGFGADREWLASFCRYDYTRGREKPVLSSTSPYPRKYFHDNTSWRKLLFD
ncbi:MAG: hypothetical protein PHD76_02425 [Methylacidiphilales bacterium]|nr:hypothetical protein [Candidatus Methylacidiphilales bacterium]